MLKLAGLLLVALGCFAQNAQQRTSDTSSRTPEQWRSEYRKALQDRLTAASGYFDYVKKQNELGIPVDLLGTERLALEMDRDLAAFDAGMIAERPRQSLTPAMTQARERYRQMAKRDIELSEQIYEKALKSYQLGSNQQVDLIKAQLRFANSKLEILAFEAGLELPPHANVTLPQPER